MNVGFNPINMHMQMLMKCLCSALGMLIHACNLVAPPPRPHFDISLLLRVIALDLYKGLHATEARPVQICGSWAGPGSLAPYG